jgi:hypothetical protein
MNEVQHPLQPENSDELQRWLGRREAFGTIAGRCSAADILCLKQIRDQKLYLAEAESWEEFCPKKLKVSRRKVDRDIKLLEELGPEYYLLAQLVRITPAEFRRIRQHVTEEGVKLGGEVIALLPENTERLAEAVTRVREDPAVKTQREHARFDDLLKRCEKINSILEENDTVLDTQQKIDLAGSIIRMNQLVARLGVLLIRA